jgi:hypothetical protein
MTKRLEEVFNLPQDTEPFVAPEPETKNTQVISLEDRLEEFDKISAALPRVKGLGDISDAELDALATRAEDAFNELYDLGMSVDPRYGARMFEVAAQMMNAAITAKSNKIDKKLKMIDLQIKKYAIDKKNGTAENTSIDGEGYIITDRNSILEKLKNINK